MFKPFKPKRTCRVGEKVFLTNDFRKEVEKHRKGRLKLQKSVKRYTDKGEETWHMCHGLELRFAEVYVLDLKRRPLNFLISLKKEQPQIMIVGPMWGYDILELKKELHRVGISPEVDILGLTKTIVPRVQKEVRTDFSQNVALETIGSNPNKYAKLINAMKGKYDLVMAPASAGLHTLYPTHNCFFMALMLSQGGEAYVQTYTILNSRKGFIKVQDRILKLFPKFVESYNKQNGTNLRFNIEPIEPDTMNGGLYLRIKRIQ